VLELEGGTGTLCDLGLDKATAEASIIRAVDAARMAHEQE
jgi:hypothetical protein